MDGPSETTGEETTMPNYCDRYYIPDAQVEYADENDTWTTCDDPHCGQCDNYCDGCSECSDYYDDERRYGRCADIWPVTIHSYGYKPNPTFWSVGGFSSNRLSGRFGRRQAFLGCEVECEVDYDRSMRTDALARSFYSHEDMSGRIYCKSDSSLDDGVELVSHPMTLDAWQELHAMGETRFYDDLRRAGMHTPHTCGMHVHLNKSAFKSQVHLARFSHLIIGNMREMEEVAGRRNTGYASFERFPICRVIKSGGSIYGPRGAVNLGNENTVEVRMFAGTLYSDRIMANLEACHSMMAYTRERILDPSTGKPIQDHLSFASYAEWVRTPINAKSYPALVSLDIIQNGGI